MDSQRPRITPLGVLGLAAAACAAVVALAGTLGLAVRVFRWAAWGPP